MHLRRFLSIGAVFAAVVIMSHSQALAQGVNPLFAVLLGGNEVDANHVANQGDPNGFGGATVIIRGTDTVCFGITVNGIDKPTLAHIHADVAGTATADNIVVPLFGTGTPIAAPASGSPGAVSGCVSASDFPDITDFADTLRRIRANPSKFYVNVHTTAFPAGAIRGQLF
jgi:3-oxoacyl-(acyl-carrier-protein) synthase